MNIILTCAGRRNYLVEYFRQAIAGNGRVIVTDSSADAPAMQEADAAFVVPPVKDPGYISFLLSLCERERVGMLISLNDLELPVLAANRESFMARGIVPVVSSPEVVDLCFDKWKTVTFLQSIGLSAPVTVLLLEDAREALARGELSFPLVVKPRWGTASIGIEFPEDEAELELAYALLKRRLMRTMLADVSATDPDRCILIQERLRGQEYGLDIVNDLRGRPAAVFVKKKLAMRAGETDRAVTEEQPAIAKEGHVIGTRLGHVGNLDCDVFLTPNGPRVLELNPRFGGGYPFSHVAGANLPAALIAWAQNREPTRAWLSVRAGVCAAKCDRLVVRID